MPIKSNVARSSAANSFKRSEIDAMVQMMRAAISGRDVIVMMRNEDLRSVYAKFVRMQERIAAAEKAGKDGGAA